MSCLQNHPQESQPPLTICIECGEESLNSQPNPETVSHSPSRKSKSPPRRQIPPATKEAQLSASDKKGHTRRSSRKRRKQKAVERLSSAVGQLREVLEEIYCGVDTYDPNTANIQELVSSISDEKKFYELLNQIIKDLIEVFKENIWRAVDHMIEEWHTNGQKGKDCHKISEWPEFYRFFIDLLYDKVQSIKVSSRQVEKIICQYNQHYEAKCPQTGKASDREIQMDLFRNTFMYMVNNDRHLKRFMKVSQKMLMKDLNTDRANQQSLAKLREMVALLRPLESDEDDEESDYDDADSESCDRNLDSTSNASTDVCQEDTQVKPKKKKKKKKAQNVKEPQNSTKDSLHSLNCPCQPEQEHIRSYVTWLDRCAINKQRLQCDFDRGWLESIEQQLRSDVELRRR